MLVDSPYDPENRICSLKALMRKFSAWALLREAFAASGAGSRSGGARSRKPEYDAVIVGGGGHGLGSRVLPRGRAPAQANVAVVEKGWIGGGNTGRNTTIIRSNYLFDESARLYDHALQACGSDLSQVLNYNVMYSPRGVMMLAHTVHDVQVLQAARARQPLQRRRQRVARARRGEGASARRSTSSPTSATRCIGASLQRRGGTARHDAVAWGYARAADALGVDIVENCEVTGIRRDASGAVEALETSRGPIRMPTRRRVRRGQHQRRAAAWPACACRSRVFRCRRSSRSR